MKQAVRPKGVLGANQLPEGLDLAGAQCLEKNVRQTMNQAVKRKEESGAFLQVLVVVQPQCRLVGARQVIWAAEVAQSTIRSHAWKKTANGVHPPMEVVGAQKQDIIAMGIKPPHQL